MHLTWMTLFIAALACFRISLLFSKESGPSRIFAKLSAAPPKRSAVAEWLSCIFCFSMTGSAFVCGLLWCDGLRGSWAFWFQLWCALSAVTVVVNQRFTKGEL